MKQTRHPFLVALVAVLAGAATLAALAALAPTSTAADTSARERPVYWISLGGDASQHPRYVYFTVGSGGYVKHVRWSHWGKYKTIGRGTFGTTQPCGPQSYPCPDGPATMTLRDPVRCTPEYGDKKGRTVLVYRHARLVYPDGEGGTEHADISDRAGWQVCKQSG